MKTDENQDGDGVEPGVPVVAPSRSRLCFGLPFTRWAAVLVCLGAFFLALDILTLFGTLTAQGSQSSPTGGFDVWLKGGTIELHTGDGFARVGDVRWQPGGTRRTCRFSTDWYTISGFLNWRVTTIPLWNLWLPMLVASAFGYTSPASRRRAAGLCAHCGYCLAGTPAASPCPECGRNRT